MATATHAAKIKAPGPKHNIEAMREEYYARIAKHDMTPLWKVMASVVTKEPVTRCHPVIWHYDDIKRLVMESGGLITAEEAERRVLILENPGMRGESRATNTLFAGVQMILPGEVAPAHRHVSSAIRFVLDGEGAYTAVEGEKAYMAKSASPRPTIAIITDSPAVACTSVLRPPFSFSTLEIAELVVLLIVPGCIAAKP